MLKPVNGHLLIEPLKHESFMASEKEVYEEVGVVIDIARDLDKRVLSGVEWSGSGATVMVTDPLIKIGDRVFFDSYLAAKYPKNDNEYYWLVQWQDVRAIEYAEEIPK